MAGQFSPPLLWYVGGQTYAPAAEPDAIEFEDEDFDLATTTSNAFRLATTSADAFDLATTTSDSFVIT